ncbi:MAG: alpha/beta fold hydrolase [Lautropia sp.]|nr:alpha/beta fold hydrolase [Lautropia sp.]
MSDVYREQLVQLGENQHLIGTLVEPVGTKASVGVVFLNAGVIHRIGPHRIHVKLARALAADGMPSLRLDLSGLGDSRRASGTDGMLAQVRRDIRSAVDLMAQRTGLTRFVIIGICSGAEYGYQYAPEDSRVAGLVMVDGYSFANHRTRLLRYGLRLRTLTWPVLKKAVQGRLARLRAGAGPTPAAPADYGLPVVTVTDFGHGLAERARQSCPCYLVFTGSVLHRYNHASQFDDVMKAAALSDADRALIARDVRCDFLPEIDHTMTTLHGQRVYIGHVRQWLATLPAEPGGLRAAADGETRRGTPA